jgi:hypothetical protein
MNEKTPGAGPVPVSTRFHWTGGNSKSNACGNAGGCPIGAPGILPRLETFPERASKNQKINAL